MSEGKEKSGLTLPNFEMVGMIGCGGMASVWKARQISLDRMVAVKILSSAFAGTPEDVQQFRFEARTAAQLKHPNIVQVYDANFSEGVYYFVMELVDGYTMGEHLKRKGRMPAEDVLIIAESVAVALDYAWSFYAMVHCDIKPDNIMVDVDGTVKVTDLGLCRSLHLVKDKDRTQLAEDEILGTPAYMSPEQIYGTSQLDARSDIYSLGASLYHLLTGRMLFQGRDNEAMIRAHVDASQAPDARSYVTTLSPSISMLLEKMLAKKPADRYPDWKHVLTDIRRIQARQLIWPTHFPPYRSSMLRQA